jgi:hypothetical protein
LASELIVAGGGVGSCGGGAGGYGPTCNGATGVGIYSTGELWYSGLVVPPTITVAAGTATQAVPSDPTLSLSGTATAGGSVTLRLFSEPGSIARLIVGATPIVLPTPGVQIEQLETRDRSIFLGVVPASGYIDRVIQIPSNYPVGALMFAQGRLVLPVQGEVRRTNSVPMIVR